MEIEGRVTNTVTACFPNCALGYDRTLSQLEMETLQEPAQQLQGDGKRRDYFIGVVLLLAVVLLWTIGNFVTQVSCVHPPQSETKMISIVHI
jgi:hypothetical protein